MRQQLSSCEEEHLFDFLQFHALLASFEANMSLVESSFSYLLLQEIISAWNTLDMQRHLQPGG